jgi:hypothetical protein
VLGLERGDDLRHLGIALHLLKLPRTVEHPSPATAGASHCLVCV